MTTATAVEKGIYIDGHWTEAADGQTLSVINPATEETLAVVAYGGRADARRALEAAARALPGWMKLTAWDRAKVLKKTADLMRERADAIAKTMTLEQGKPLPEAKAVDLFADVIGDAFILAIGGALIIYEYVKSSRKPDTNAIKIAELDQQLKEEEARIVELEETEKRQQEKVKALEDALEALRNHPGKKRSLLPS